MHKTLGSYFHEVLHNIYYMIRLRPRLLASAAAAATGGAAYLASSALAEPAAELLQMGEADVEVVNWSMTHSTTAKRYFQPESPEEVQRLLELLNKAGERVRVVGSALSPNGIAFSDQGMMNMAQCNSVLSVDAERKQVTVQAGARVTDVVEALRPHGLTLQNYASIAEQQIGGFLQARPPSATSLPAPCLHLLPPLIAAGLPWQVGAHGTGAGVPPVDEQVVRFKLHTPAMGTLDLTAEGHPRLFWLAKVGLGLLGVVSEVTLQCVPAHKLLERTFVQTRAEVPARPPWPRP